MKEYDFLLLKSLNQVLLKSQSHVICQDTLVAPSYLDLSDQKRLLIKSLWNQTRNRFDTLIPNKRLT